MANARLTLGAVLGTVSTAANTVSTVLNTATASVSMLDQFVQDAVIKQKARSIADMDSFIADLAEEKSQERSIRQRAVLDFCRQSEEHAQLYTENYNRIFGLLTEYQASRTASAAKVLKS